MLLEPPDQQRLAAAEGYLALGMCEDANSELEEIDPFCRRLPEVLTLRLGIYQRTKRWEMAQVVAKQLAVDDASNPQWPSRLRTRPADWNHSKQQGQSCSMRFHGIQRSRSSTTTLAAIVANWEISNQRKIT